jgi:hypothetical protein
MPGRSLRQRLQALLVLIILAFWAFAIARNWQELADYSWSTAWGPWLLAFILLIIQAFVLTTIWWRALALVGAKMSWRLATAVWLKAQIARYLPGGIWDMSGRVLLSQELGVSKRASSASLGLEMGIQVLSASFFLLLVLALRAGEVARIYLPLTAVVIVGALVLLAPPVFTKFVNTGLLLLRRPPLNVQMTYRDVLTLFLARLLAHGLLGVGFVLFLGGLTPIAWEQAPLLASAYVGAWLIGYLTLLAPTGIGVREGVLVFLVGNEIGFAAATVAALGYRILIALRDLVVALIGARMAPASPPADSERR